MDGQEYHKTTKAPNYHKTVTAGVISCVGRGVTAAVTGRRCVWYRLVLLLRLHQ